MVKIKSYAISKAGRGLKITLPAVWVDDLGLAKGQKLDLYRDREGRLMILPPGVSLPDMSCGQAREMSAALAGRME